ncbi:FMN reductase [Leeia sp. TBRC 13508]|uniref:FMN reductase n=1 Tax=Leeia speluncae TaxID=2884804 RepID=A0ABS8DA20_9NEIS|nr:FMN reductase [Leeia speluncae]MCB6185050.1 FMN reductase [Leeia speluncae]
MANPLNVVAVSGSLNRPSRTLALVEHILERIQLDVPVNIRLIEVGNIAEGLANARKAADLPTQISADVKAIETADFLVVASPVYRASYTGLFKHLFDLVDHTSLIDVPVFLAATGGSDRHALVIDHQLRPLFSFFQALTLPIGVYGAESDFTNYQISNQDLIDRIDLAVARALPYLKHRHLPVSQPSELTAASI